MFRIGDCVRITNGAFVDMQGEIISPEETAGIIQRSAWSLPRSGHEYWVAITIFGRRIAVEMQAHHLQ